jgi:hypothetical protein
VLLLIYVLEEISVVKKHLQRCKEVRVNDDRYLGKQRVVRSTVRERQVGGKGPAVRITSRKKNREEAITRGPRRQRGDMIESGDRRRKLNVKERLQLQLARLYRGIVAKRYTPIIRCSHMLKI